MELIRDEQGSCYKLNATERRLLDERKRELAGEEFMSSTEEAENWLVHNAGIRDEVLIMFRAAVRFAQSPRSPDALHGICNAVEAAKDAYANDHAERFHDQAWDEMRTA